MRREPSARRSLGFNFVVLACAVPAALVCWIIIGELIGDVSQSGVDGGGLLIDAVEFVVGTLYVSLVLVFLFVPGFAVFLMLVEAVSRRFRVSTRDQRVVAVVLSPIVGAVFVLIPAIPEDRDGVWSGWWFVLGTGLIVALLARLPRATEPLRPTSAVMRERGSAA